MPNLHTFTDTQRDEWRVRSARVAKLTDAHHKALADAGGSLSERLAAAQR